MSHIRLQFNRPYLSIKEFESIELPSFTVLTGVNGSGKSHLLRAITQEDLSLTLTGIKTPTSVLVDARSSFQFGGGPEKQTSIAKNDLWVDFQPLQKMAQKNSRIRADNDQILAYVNNKHKLFRFSRRILLAAVLEKMANTLDLQAMDENRFKSAIPVHIYDESDISVNYSHIAWGYYKKYLHNKLLQIQHEEGRIKTPPLTDAAFQESHGEEPWNMLNRILKLKFGSPYRVDNPYGMDIHGKYMARFHRDGMENDEKIDFQNFSSGEKAIMAIVMALYRKKTSGASTFPNVLLLDEPDSHLHPSLSENMVSAIVDDFVRDKEINVIWVTHSPSTVAYAPEESIYVMNPLNSGKPRIEKQSKAAAISILSDGVISHLFEGDTILRMEYDLRESAPIMLVEGMTDVLILDRAWKKLHGEQDKRFSLFSCLCASMLKGALDNDAVFSGRESSLVFALFDFDFEGYHKWNGLNSQKWEDVPDAHLRVKKHKERPWYAMLLPVPPELESQSSPQVPGGPCIDIELLFYNKEGVDSSSFGTKPTVGGGEIIDFRGDKKRFAKGVDSLPVAAFENFRPIFEFINSKIGDSE